MSEDQEAITGMEAPVYLQYSFTAGKSPARFLWLVAAKYADLVLLWSM